MAPLLVVIKEDSFYVTYLCQSAFFCGACWFDWRNYRVAIFLKTPKEALLGLRHCPGKVLVARLHILCFYLFYFFMQLFDDFIKFLLSNQYSKIRREGCWEVMVSTWQVFLKKVTVSIMTLFCKFFFSFSARLTVDCLWFVTWFLRLS